MAPLWRRPTDQTKIPFEKSVHPRSSTQDHGEILHQRERFAFSTPDSNVGVDLFDPLKTVISGSVGPSRAESLPDKNAASDGVAISARLFQLVKQLTSSLPGATLAKEELPPTSPWLLQSADGGGGSAQQRANITADASLLSTGRAKTPFRFFQRLSTRLRVGRSLTVLQFSGEEPCQQT